MSTLTVATLRRAFSSRLGPRAAARLAPLATAPRALSTSAILANEPERAKGTRSRPAGPSAYARGGSRVAFRRPQAMREADARQEPAAELDAEPEEPAEQAQRHHLRHRGREPVVVDPLSTRNYQIPFDRVHLVGEDSKLSGLVLLRPIVDSIDLKTESVICVQAEPPVVKIVNNVEEKQKEREREEKIRLSRRLAVDDKELQMGWGAADGDVQHKIDTAIELLKKGDRVHIVFALRASSGGKKQRIPDERKMQILEMFEEGVADVAKKWKEDEQSRGLWIQHWAPKDSVATEARAKLLVEGVEKRKARDERKEARKAKEEERLRKAKERQALGLDNK